MKLRLICLLLFAFQPIRATYSEFDYSNEASPPGGARNASLTEPVHHPLKFTDFIGPAKLTLEIISTTVCNLSLAAYQGNATARAILGPVSEYCWTHADCILSTTSQHITASFSGTSILLGLAPTTLSVLGPSVAEMALLSIYRPLLSLLLSLGAPAVFPGRFLTWEDPLKANEPRTGAFVMGRLGKKTVVAVSVLEYVVVLLALANIIHATYWTGIRSIVSWDCRSSYWPLLWVMLSVAIHFTAVLSLRTAIQRKNPPVMELPPTGTEPDSRNGSLERTRSCGGRLVKILRDEITPCANSAWHVFDVFGMRLGLLPVALQYTGAFIAVCHLVFGTLLFSSLLFIEVGNAMVLILRLMASAVACRMVLQFEVGGMIKADERRVYKWIVQPVHEGKLE